MKRYLIKEWHPHRGQTAENPACYFCGGYIYHHPLTEVRKDFSYTSAKRAERVAIKHSTIYTRTEVVEVPEGMLV